MRKLRAGLVLSRLSYSPFIPITKFVSGFLIESSLTLLQGFIAVRNKNEDLLSRIAALEKHFNSRPNDIPELRLRSEVIWYAPIPPVVFGAKFLPASSRELRSNFGCCARDGD